VPSEVVLLGSGENQAVFCETATRWHETATCFDETGVKPPGSMLDAMQFTSHAAAQEETQEAAQKAAEKTPNEAAPEPAVTARGLVKRFGDFEAVGGIDLNVRRGEVFGVLGPNGAGKTTTLNMLATLLPITAGEAQIFGYDVRTQSHEVRQVLGLTGQYASVDEGLTATENMRMFARLLGFSRAQSRARTEELLSEFHLEDAAHKTISQFSGGMRRRLDLAVSLITRPPLIFLDEPTTGLDPRTRGQMWETIRSLVHGGATVLLTTQYLEEADQLSDRIAVIDEGEIVALGTPEQLKTSIGASTLHVVLNDPTDSQRAIAALGEINGRAPNPENTGSRLTLPLGSADESAEALIALRTANISINEVSVQKPSLDEVFLTITGQKAHRNSAKHQETK